MKKLFALLLGICAALVAMYVLYEFGKYPGEKYLMDSWKGK